MHHPPSTSLLSVFNPFTSLNVPYGPFFISKCVFSLLYPCFSHCILCFICNAFIPQIILFSTVPTHRPMCTIFLYCLLRLFILQPPLPILTLSFQHASSPTFKIPSFKCPHKFCTPASNNSTNFSSNHFQIFESFNKLIILLTVHVFLTALLIFFIYICYH